MSYSISLSYTSRISCYGIQYNPVWYEIYSHQVHSPMRLERHHLYGEEIVHLGLMGISRLVSSNRIQLRLGPPIGSGYIEAATSSVTRIFTTNFIRNIMIDQLDL